MELAASQWSLFTSAQAVALGVSRTQLSRMLTDGRIEQRARGTYFVANGTEAQHTGAKAAWISLFPKETAWERLGKRPFDAVATGRTAAALLGDTELHPEPYTFAVGKGKRTARKDVRLCMWSVDQCDVRLVDGLPTAGVERTTADLIRLREDPSLVDGFVRSAVLRGETIDEARLAELLAPLAARNGYTRNDGAAFARDIIARDVVPVRLAKLRRQLQETSCVVGAMSGVSSEVAKALSVFMEAIEPLDGESIGVAYRDG